MRHNKSGKRLGRNTSHRKAMLRNMVTSLFEHEKITTTDARAKELRKVAERLVSLGKRGDLHARRQAASVLRDRKTVAKLFDRIAPRYLERPGGYTRIIKLGLREGDKAALSIIELVEEEFSPKAKKKTPAAKKQAKKEAPETVKATDEEKPVPAEASPADTGEAQEPAEEPQSEKGAEEAPEKPSPEEGKKE